MIAMYTPNKTFQTLFEEFATKACGIGDIIADYGSEDSFSEAFMAFIRTLSKYLDSNEHSDDEAEAFIHAQIRSFRLEGRRKQCQIEDYCTGAYVRWFSSVVKVPKDQLVDKDYSGLVSVLKVLQNENLIHLKSWQGSAMKLALPLQLIYKLNKAHLMSFDSYFAQNVENAHNLNFILDELTSQNVSNLLKCTPVLAMCLTTLIFASFNLQIPTRHCRSVANEILRRAVVRIWEETWHTKDTIVSFEWLMGDSLEMDLEVQYAKQSWASICCSGTEASTSKDAIAQQAKWTFAETPINVTTFIQALFKPLTPQEVANVLESVLERPDINWRSLLSVISTCLVSNAQILSGFQGLVNSLVKSGIDGEDERLVHAFLFVRQAGQENRYSFPSYKRWFGSMFGEASKTVSKSCPAFRNLLKVLTSLVPLETQEILTFHVCNPPAAPKECREDLNDYLTLARTRLSDLGVDLRSRHETDEGSAAVKRDVASAIAAYQKLKRLPPNVLEMSFFRKAYFMDQFLRLLLQPGTTFPDCGAKECLEFIEALKTAGKLPQNLYDEYIRTSNDKALGLDEDVMEIDGDIETDINNDLISVIVRLKQTLSQIPSPEREILKLRSSLEVKLENLVGKSDKKDSSNTPSAIHVDNCDLKTWPADKVVEALVKLFQSWSEADSAAAQTMVIFVGSLKPFANVQKALYHDLRDNFKKIEAGTSIRMLARWLFVLELQKEVLLPVKTLNSKSSIPFALYLLETFRVRKTNEMEFFYKLATFLLHEWETTVSDIYLGNDSSLSCVWKKYSWIKSRLRFSMHRVDEEWGQGLPSFESSNYDSLNKLTLSDWLAWEMGVAPCNDVLKPTERQLYLHQYFVSNFGGIENLNDFRLPKKDVWVLEDASPEFRPVLVLFHHIVLEKLQLFTKSGSNSTCEAQDNSQAFIMLLQLVLNRPVLDNKIAWLPVYWLSFHERRTYRNLSPEIIDMVIWSIVEWLPPQLLLCSSLKKTTPLKGSLEALSKLVCEYWKENLSQDAFLPLNVVVHLALGLEETGLLDPKIDGTLLRKFVESTGPFKASFQVHSERLSQLLMHIVSWEGLFTRCQITWQLCSLNRSSWIVMSTDLALNRNLVISVLIQITVQVFQGTIDLTNLIAPTKIPSPEASKIQEIAERLLEAFVACPTVIEAFDPRFWKSSRLGTEIPSVIFELLPYTTLFVLVRMAGSLLTRKALLQASLIPPFLEALLLVYAAWTRQSTELFREAEQHSKSQAWLLADYRMLGMLRKNVIRFLQEACPSPVALQVNKEVVAMVDDELRTFFKP